MRRFFSYTILQLVFSVSLFFLFTSPTHAETQCCVMPASGTTRSCRLESGSTCNQQLPASIDLSSNFSFVSIVSYCEEVTGYSVISPFSGVEAIYEAARTSLDDTKLASFSNCVQSAKSGYGPERRVSCISEEICRQAVGKQTDCSAFNDDSKICDANTNCFSYGGLCHNRNDAGACTRLDKANCGQSTSGGIKGSLVCVWDEASKRCLSRVEQNLSSRYEYNDQSLLTPCAAKGNCRGIEDVLVALLRIASFAFRYIGTAAFLFFIYGGFVIILSFGNSEKVNQGKQILTAAVVGIIIIFSAYILVTFILKTLGAASDFRLLL